MTLTYPQSKLPIFIEIAGKLSYSSKRSSKIKKLKLLLEQVKTP